MMQVQDATGRNARLRSSFGDDRDEDHDDHDDHFLLADPLGDSLEAASPTTAAITMPIERDGHHTRNIAMLFGLYFMHSLPLAFGWGTMPVLLREQASYLAVGTFVLTQYPYSLKIFWSPIVEALNIPRLGHKKTWLFPNFLALAVTFWWLASHQDALIRDIASGSASAMAWLLFAWLGVSFFCANIRITLDAWSLEVISPAKINWFGPTVTIGETLGSFVAFNVFLGLSYLQEPSSSDQAAIKHASVHGFFTAVAIGLTITACLILLTHESRQLLHYNRSVRHTYAIILRILRLPQVWTLFAVHMISLVGFITNDSITVLQLVKNGFSDSDIALIATLDFPFVAAAGVLVSRLVRNRHPLQLWRQIFPLRLLAAVVAQLGVMLIYTFRDHPWRWYIAIVPDICTTSLEVAMFVCIMTFHAEVSDPRHGAIYLPLLGTTLDLRYAVLQFFSTKMIGVLDGGEGLEQATRLVDGYQIVNTVAVLIAMPLFWFYLRPATMWLQGQHKDKWRVDKSETVYEQVPLEERHTTVE